MYFGKKIMKENMINQENETKIGYKIHLEKGKDFNTSIFQSVYESAKESVKDIIANTQYQNIHKYYTDDYNNIIAFTGERGRGKSSTMISFLDAIVNKSDKDQFVFFEKTIDNKEYSWDQNSFITIDVIDPTLFREREKETLFEIVIAKMFSAFRKQIVDDNSKNIINDEQRRSLIKCFQKAFEDLKYLKNRDDIFKEDALDALIKLSTSSNLKESFERLVEEYLKVLGDSRKQNFLVIAIDDFDLKIDGVYEMLEDVRRFLISRKIILLISCKMEQMRQALELYIKNLKIDGSIALNQVEKYIEKLFPTSRVIEMPSPQEIDWNKGKLRAFFYDDITDASDVQVESTFNKSVLRKIYEQLGLFIAEDAYVNNIFIGNSMRSVIGLKKSWNNIETLTKYIKTYFNQIGTNLSEIEFILECDIVILNYRIYKLLYNSFKHLLEESEVKLLKSEQLSYKFYLKEDINSLFFIVNEKIKLDEKNYDLFRAAKTFYELRIHHILNEKNNTYGFRAFQNSNRGSLLNVNLLTTKYRISSNRDSFISTLNPYDIGKNTEDKSEKIIMYSFVYSLGKDIFGDVRMGGNFKSFVFSILNFINSINNLEYPISRYTTEDFAIEDYTNIWRNSKFFKLFNNSDFILIFYKEFLVTYNYFNKDSLFKGKHYNEIIYTMLYDCMIRIFGQINDQYPYLELDYDDFVNSNKLFEKYLELYSNESIASFINNAYSFIESEGSKVIWEELDIKINGKSRITNQWFENFINKIQNNEIKEYLLLSQTQSLMFDGKNPELKENRNIVLEEVKKIENSYGQSSQND